MKLTKWFKINGEEREFMYLYGSLNRCELQPFINLVKSQGDLYRVVKSQAYYELWDARI